MPNTLSLHMIVRNEEDRLARCLDSIAPHVDEIVIADTGSTDKTMEVAARYNARIVYCDALSAPDNFFHDDAETIGAPANIPITYSRTITLGNFGAARNLALEHTTGDYVMWVDADDVVENAQMLRTVVQDMALKDIDTAWMKYLYGFDDRGRPVCTLWRERIVKRGSAHWVNPIHEVMIPNRPDRAMKIDPITIRHARDSSKTAVVAQRNYKVLLQHLKQNPDDARTLFYFGNEARHIDVDAALTAYERYVEVSGWGEERAFARCCIGELYEQKGQFGKAAANFAASAMEGANIPDGCFGLARIAYYKQDWAECCRYTELGLARGNPETVIMMNPLARDFLPHVFYNIALNNIGKVKEAYESCRRALEVVPEDTNMQHNLRVYGTFIGAMARRPNRRKSTAAPLEVVIWTGSAVEPWTVRSPDTTGIGGSETACIEVSRNLVKLGHQVTVYSDCTPEGEGVFDGVNYVHHSKFRGCVCDVFISSRQPQIADAPVQADLKLLWVHDIHVGQPNPQMHRWLLWFDRAMCLSEWHKAFFLRVYPFVHPETVLVTRNGIDPDRFEDELVENAGRPGEIRLCVRKTNKLVFSSSANRGLDVLLDVFPRIRAQVPDAELHVFYGFESWERTARMFNLAGDLEQIERYKQRLAEMARSGVVFRGRVDQRTLAREMMESKVWAYPTAFTETSCITAVEAQAAGCIPVTSKIAALAESVQWGVLLDGVNTSPEYQDVFVRETVALLRDDAKRSAIAGHGRAWALERSWEALAREWAAMFYATIADVDDALVPRWEEMINKAA